MTGPWTVHKFGGTSLADADGFRRAAAIVAGGGGRRAVVVSAMSGVTDALLDLIRLAETRDAAQAVRLRALRRRVIETIGEVLEGAAARELVAAVERDLDDVEDVLRAIWLLRTGPESARDLIGGFGELWSGRLLAAVLTASGRPARWLDARDVLVVEPGPLAPVVRDAPTRERLERHLAAIDEPILVLPGFVAGGTDGLPTTLGRNGSDYSASIVARLLGATMLTIWTDVDGVLSADPRRVPDAVVLDEMSYDEAMELAYFGAKVIHPATMAPAVAADVPIFIRNSRRPDAPGTRIHPAPADARAIRGLASIEGMALVNLEGTNMIGVPGIAERLFGSLREAGVSVSMISQGSSEHSICFVVPGAQAEAARAAVERAFAAERQHGQIQTVDVLDGCAVLAVVGDRMAGRPGVAGRVFAALGRAGINVRAIAQGASERNISVVIEDRDTTRALRAVHAGFYLSRQTLAVGLIGPGHVGATLLDQLAAQGERLAAEANLELRLRGVCGSRRMLLDERTVDPAGWRARFEADAVPIDLDAFAAHVRTDSVPHAVLVDCSASPDVARRYREWLERGIHVVTPNKIGNTGPLDEYRALRALRARGAHYLYETTVGAGLPVIRTLRDLIDTGDEVLRIEGVLSGTLSYLFNAFDGARPFSEILRDARERGFTEPDPRDDLSGMDVARKVVILARELGLGVGLDDVDVESLVPSGDDGRTAAAFLDDPGDLDERMARLLDDARTAGCVLRYVGTVERDGRCAARLQRCPADHPLARIRLTDNVVLFRTRRYADNPLVVQGPGAGPAVTAGGVFADLLRLADLVGGVGL